MAEDLRALATDIEELPALDDHYDPPARAVLHHLERHLFEPTAKQVEPADAVRLLVAGGERAEVELVAAEVLKLLRDHGVPGEQIAVVLRAPGESASLVAQVFGAYGIPHALDWRVPLAHTALGRGVLALARCALVPEQARPTTCSPTCARRGSWSGSSWPTGSSRRCAAPARGISPPRARRGRRRRAAGRCASSTVSAAPPPTARPRSTPRSRGRPAPSSPRPTGAARRCSPPARRPTHARSPCC